MNSSNITSYKPEILKIKNGFKKRNCNNCNSFSSHYRRKFPHMVCSSRKSNNFVVSDYGNYLDGVKNIHEVLEESIEIDYQSLRMEKYLRMIIA